MKRLALLALLMCVAIPAFGQGIRFGDGVPVISGQVPAGPIYTVPNAGISFCNSPAVNVPCTNRATTYTDATDTSACPTNQQITLVGSNSCVGTTDSFGNWGVWVPAGTYTYTIQLPTGGSLGPYTITVGGSGGGGGGTPASPNGGVQVYNPTGPAFGTVTGLSSVLFGLDSFTSPTIFNNPFSQANAGPNPIIDTLMYNMRGVLSPPSFTFTSSGSSAVINMTGGSYASLQNGDGVVFPGAGIAPSPSIAAPTITVTPCLISGVDTMNDCVAAPAGSTTYNYSAVLRDKGMGYTAAGATGTTTTGTSGLGVISQTISTQTRSGQATTVTLAGNLPCAVGAIVFDTNSTDASFSGFFKITLCNGGTSPANTTSITFTQGYSTTQPIPFRAGPTYSTNSATGGTLQVYSGNLITLPTISGNGYQYWIYTAGGAFLGYARPFEASYIDRGATAPALPFWIPSTAPSSAQNDALATTIVSGGGSSQVTVASPATTGISTTGSFDDAPTFQNACNAAIAGTGAALQISNPGTNKFYYFMSHVSCGTSESLHIYQRASIFLNETMDIIATWSGKLGGQNGTSGAFGYGTQQIINVVGAYPGLHFFGTSALENVTVQPGIQGLGWTIGSGGNFNVNVENVNCALPSTDITGECSVTYGVSNMNWRNVSVSTNGSSARGYSFTPLILNRDDVAGANGSGDFTCYGCFFTGRGFGWETVPLSSNALHISFLGNTYSQQVIGGPVIMMGPGNSPVLTVNGGRNDSSSLAFIANFGTSLTAILQNIPDNSTETGGAPGFVTGNPISNIDLVATGAQPWLNTAVAFVGQNINVNERAPGCLGINQLANNCSAFNLQVNGNANITGTGTFGNVSIPTGNITLGAFVSGTPQCAQWTTSGVLGGTGAPCGGGGGAGTVTHTLGALTTNAVVLGNGGADVTVLGSLGTTTTVLHGNASGAPSFAAVTLTTDVTGVLPIANGGSGAATFSAHNWLGNNGASTAAPAPSLIGTSDVTPNECAADTGAVNVLVVAPTPSATALVQGLEACFIPNHANTTTTPTLNLSALGAATIVKAGGALAANDLLTTRTAVVRYNATNSQWELLNPQTATGCATQTGDVTTSGGTCATTLAAIQGGTLTISNLHTGDVIFSPDGVTFTNGPSGVVLNQQTGMTYPVVTGDRTKLITSNNSTSQAYAGPTLSAGFTFALWNLAPVVNVYTPASGNINGAGTMNICPQCFTMIYTDGSNSFSPIIPTVASAAFAATPLTDSATVTWAIGSALYGNQHLTFTVHSGSRTLNVSGMVSGGNYTLILKQDSTGGEGLTLGTGCTWKVIGGGGGAITPSTGANAVDVLAWTYDGTSCFATFGKNFN